jgi:hypothetical protein
MAMAVFGKPIFLSILEKNMFLFHFEKKLAETKTTCHVSCMIGKTRIFSVLVPVGPNKDTVFFGSVPCKLPAPCGWNLRILKKRFI